MESWRARSSPWLLGRKFAESIQTVGSPFDKSASQDCGRREAPPSAFHRGNTDLPDGIGAELLRAVREWVDVSELYGWVSSWLLYM